jgi:hypothetical protein
MTRLLDHAMLAGPRYTLRQLYKAMAEQLFI